VEDDGRELLYFSRSSGSVPGDIYVSERAEQGGFGPASPVGQDVYVSTRERLDQPWSTPTNLGTAVNTAANETRPSLSWDARTLYFGRAPGPEGMSDIYVSTREELAGSGG